MLHFLKQIKNSSSICNCRNVRFVFYQQYHEYSTIRTIEQMGVLQTTHKRWSQIENSVTNRHQIYNQYIFNCKPRSSTRNIKSISSNLYDKKNLTENTSDNGIQQQQQQQQQPQQQTGIFRKVRRIVDIFWTGCKALLKDVRIAFRTRRKLGLYHAQDFNRLTRQELRHLRQTRQDVVKTFPVALLFMVPFIGYTAPLMAYFYPRQLLSQQFWHPDQKKEFVLEEYEQRSQYYLPLIKEVGVTAKEIGNKELLKFCLHILHGTHPQNHELLYYKEIFSTNEDLKLNGMPRYHLIKLCKCWLIPTAWYLPRWFLMSALRKRIARLHEDDAFIKRDGVELLTPECVEQAVHVRGLDEASLCDISKLHWLTDWINLSNQVEEKDVSFLAHAAIFKAANFEAIRNGNSSSSSYEM